MLQTGKTIIKELYKIQVIRFLAVGIFSVAVEFLVFATLVNLLKVNYMQANLGAMSVSILCNYMLSRQVVFEGRRCNEKVTFALFVVFTLAGVLLNQYLLWFLVEVAARPVLLGKVLAIGAVAVFNFLAKKYIIFRD